MRNLKKLALISCVSAAASVSMPTLADDVASVALVDLFSATFDNGGVALAPDGTFFSSPPAAPRNTTFTPVGTANGGTTETGVGVVEFDGTNLKLASIKLPDMDVLILPGAPQETTANTSGATISFATPAIDTEAGFVGFQVDGANDTDASTTIVADFTNFADATVGCVGALCGLIPTLNLDGVRYQVDGTLTAAGGDTLTVTIQTSNTSTYVVEVVTVVQSSVPPGTSAISNIDSANLIDLFSATFDNGGVALTPDGTFFSSPPAAPRNTTFTPVGTANGGITETGTGIVEYDGTTLKLAKVMLPDMDVLILPGAPQETTANTRGATIAFASPAIDTEAGFVGFQVDGANDADASTTIVADFTNFADATVGCVGALCGLIPTLNLDGVRYQVDGTMTPAGGDTLTITIQTSNTSTFIVEVITEVVLTEDNVPFPAPFIALGALLLAGIGYKKRSAFVK